jgi:molybdate transport system ATP-binding protein
MFDVSVQKRLGEFHLDVTFRSEARITALFGPSGAGKSSTISAIAGLLRPESGRVAVGGRTLYDSETGVDVRAHRRGMRVVFQESRLFPHLTVRQNLLYGRWLARGTPSPSFDEVVALLGLEALVKRRPRTLSGGERQRVAIGRALLAAPAALLLDEPLASLDASRKAEILPYLERAVASTATPILYVSHLRDEIERVAGAIVLIEAGRVTRVERRD